MIVVDPVISKETAAAAFAVYTEHRGDRPVVAMIYTQSHLGYFGGVKGIFGQADVDVGAWFDSAAPAARCPARG